MLPIFLVYVDESGKPNYSDLENFVLCSVIVNERDWQLIDTGLKQIKLTHLPHLSDDMVELHAKVLIDGGGVFKPMSPAEREALLIDVFNLLARSNIIVVAALIEKSRLTKRIDLELWGFRLLFERICWVLTKQNAALAGQGLAAEFGLLLIDSIRPRYDLQVRKKILSFLHQGTFYVTNQYLIEDPLFVSSQYRNLSQLADLVAWVIRRHHRASTNWKDYIAGQLFPSVEQKLDRDDAGKWQGAGLKIFP